MNMQMAQTEALWSDVKDSLTDPSGNVVIPHDMIVVLDESPPPLGTIAIHGTLKASENADVTLTADNVLVFGALEVGTEDAPHTREFEIVLTGEASDPDVVLADWAPDHGGMGHMGGAHAHHMTEAVDNKALIVAPGGKIDLHGAEATSWTQLNGTVEAGATSIEVLDAAGWNVGDTITIAPTGLDAFEVEDRVITSINGNTVGFDDPLEHQHYGAQQQLGDGKLLDMRAEVANLSRNITIRGEEDPNETTSDSNSAHEGAAAARVAYGGHVMVLDDTQVRIDGAEFTDLGITGEAGRYALHFHHSGDMTDSYVEDASIHHTYQRGIVIHQTDNLLLKDNVVYDVMSHGIYIEDGVETGNRFEGNLVMLPRPSAQDFRLDEIMIHNRIRESGEKASGFWITNEENEFEGNHVVGVPSGQAYWFISPDIDTSHVDRSDPRKQDNKLLQFEDNVAHTIMADKAIGGNLGYGPIWTGVAIDFTDGVGEGSAPIEGFTAWMVENMAIALPRGEGLEINDLTVADARQAIRGGTNEATFDGVTHVVTSDNFPDGVDPEEFFTVGTFKGPTLGSFDAATTIKGLEVVNGDALVTALTDERDFDNVTLLPDEAGNGLTALLDLAQTYERKSSLDDGTGKTFITYGGDDYVSGTKGSDVMYGGVGADQLYGNAGNDIIVGGEGADALHAATRGRRDDAGNDVYMAGAGEDTVKLDGKGGSTIVFAKGDGSDIVEDFAAGGGQDDKLVLVGYSAADLDADGDGDFDAADFAARTSTAETGRREVTTTLDLGNGDQIGFVNDESSGRIDFGDVSLLPNAAAASGQVAQALALDAQPGSVAEPAGEQTGDPTPPPGDAPAVDLDALIADLVAEFNGSQISVTGDVRVSGSNDGELMTGNDEANKMSGRGGDDLLVGGDGFDRLAGGGGDDALVGGAEKDWLVGGGGADRFVFGLGSDRDVIGDFDAGEGDVIDVTSAGFETFAQIADSAVQRKKGAVISAEDGSSLMIRNANVEDLEANWFDIG